MAHWRCLDCGAGFLEEPPVPRCPRCLDGLFAVLCDDLAGQAVDHGPRTPKVVGALQLRAEKFRKRPAGPVFAELFGCEQIPDGSSIAISGPPGCGKSHLLYALAEDKTFNSPLVVCGEEGLSVGVAARIERVECVRSRFTDAQNLVEITKVLGDDPATCDVDLLVLDSLNSLGLTSLDVQLLVDHYPITLLASVQTRRDGSYRGSQQLQHEFSAWVHLEKKGGFRIEKSWWGDLRSGTIPGWRGKEIAHE